MTFLHSEYHSKFNLSAKDMLEISREISRDFTPCFSSQMPERVEKIRLTPRELLDIGKEISRDFAPKVSCSKPELILLPVDPEHLHAYWNLGETRETPEPDNGLTLRIYTQAEEDSADTDEALWFDVAVDSPNTQQQVILPSPVEETTYSAAIGKQGADDSFIVLAQSNIIHAHHGPAQRHQDSENSTSCLNKNASGLGISN
ncbi:uncharacterized protein DUF4912 [Methylobacter tundripaludum]|uniref:Uncharacterized protein DUF4912 n=2 Tax=Methylobacter tundripaludum TaxID=173365 RepID=A0A2S6H2V3_9GAMM|nr:uncharacterized protein DUF4912 [Methylobacter tundripaludum]